MIDNSRTDGAVLRLRTTRAQEQAIKKMAKEKGITVSEYLRRAALAYSGRKCWPAETEGGVNG